MENKIEIRIPFMGFYETIAHDEVQRNAFMSWEGSADYCDESELPDDKKDEFWDWYMDHCKEFELELAKSYARNLADEIKKDTKIKIEFSDLIIDSPRQYNYVTDRIFVKTDVNKLLELFAKTNKKILKERIKKEFTSCPGFDSFYKNTLEEWGDPIGFDHNQWATVIKTYMKDYNIEEYELYNL